MAERRLNERLSVIRDMIREALNSQVAKDVITEFISVMIRSALGGLKGSVLRQTIRAEAGLEKGSKTPIEVVPGDDAPVIKAGERTFVNGDGDTVEKPSVKAIQDGLITVKSSPDRIYVGTGWVARRLLDM